MWDHGIIFWKYVHILKVAHPTLPIQVEWLVYPLFFKLFRLFKSLSVQLLNTCYKEDEAKTEKLLTSSLNQFPGINNLNLAVNSNNLEFVSHSSVQVLLTDVWTGEMHNCFISVHFDRVQVSWGLVRVMKIQLFSICCPVEWTISGTFNPENTTYTDFDVIKMSNWFQIKDPTTDRLGKWSRSTWKHNQ